MTENFKHIKIAPQTRGWYTLRHIPTLDTSHFAIIYLVMKMTVNCYQVFNAKNMRDWPQNRYLKSRNIKHPSGYMLIIQQEEVRIFA